MQNSNTKQRLPFQGLGFEQWWHLALVSMLATNLLIFAFAIKLTGLFNYVGLDYRTFLTSAQIARQEGFSRIYNLETQREYQFIIYESYRTTQGDTIPFDTVPTPYLPIFIVPFMLFLPFSPHIGFILYTLISAGAYVAFTYWLLRNFRFKRERKWVILGAFVSSAMFYNLFFGQVNTFLYATMGLFLISQLRGKDILSGLWLACWLIKPQILILIIPWLLINRKFKTLAGFAIGSTLVVSVSTILAGTGWFHSWFELLVRYPGGLATTNPQAMINWRSLALNLKAILPGSLAWTIAILGMAGTAFLAISTWKKYYTNEQLALSLVCNYAATCLITWHAHVHITLPVLVPLIFLLCCEKNFSYKMWSIVIGIPFLGSIAALLLQKWLAANNFDLVSLSVFCIIMYLVVWSRREYIIQNRAMQQ